jgi:hypothetical protein
MKVIGLDEVLNPNTKRYIKINGAVFKKIDFKNFSIEDQDKINKFNKNVNEIVEKKKVVIKKNDNKCINERSFLHMINIKDIDQNDLIKLSNNYCYSINELELLIDSNTFKNLNPHNQEDILFNMEKDENILKKFPKFYKKVLLALDNIKRVDGIEEVYKRLDYLYGLCKMSGIIIFDNLGSFSKKSEVFNLSLNELSEFSESFGKDNISRDLIYSLKNPKTDETVKKIIENCNKGLICIHKAGSQILQIFIYWFIKLENIYNIKYDVSKGKVIFTKVNGNKLYFRQINSNEIHDNATIYISDLLMNSSEFKKSTLYLDRLDHNKFKCVNLSKTCINNEDIYLYTNNYEISSWCDMDDKDLIKLGEHYCFGVDFILEYMDNRLNSSNMNNPSPSYPLNPFTNEILSKKDLRKIKKMVLLGARKVPLPLNIFLEDESIWVDDILQFDKYKIIDKLEGYNIRYKRINLKDSQDNYTGYWVSKKIPLSPFEKTFYTYITTLRPLYKNKLRNYPTENITYLQLSKYYLYSETI